MMVSRIDVVVGLAVVMESPACLLHVWRDGLGLVTHTNYISEYGFVKEIHDGKQWLP